MVTLVYKFCIYRAFLKTVCFVAFFPLLAEISRRVHPSDMNCISFKSYVLFLYGNIMIMSIGFKFIGLQAMKVDFNGTIESE